MPIGAFKLNGIGKFIVTAAAQVIRYKKGVQAAGNAQISTAQSKFGATSALFDGTGDHLTVDNANSNFTFGTNNFTVELWFRLSSIATSVIIWDQRTTANQSNPCIYFNSDGARIMLLESNTNRILSSAISANTWYHLAYTRSGNDHKLFLNGTQAGSTWTSSVSFGSTNPRIGANSFDGSASFNGYIDEVRVSNTARYTANFTEPSSPFTNDDNTLLLLHCDGTNASTYFEDDNGVRDRCAITAIGNAQVSTAQSKFGGSSILLDGTGDYLNVNSVSSSSSTFTIEGWFYITNNTTRTVGTIWQGDFGDSTRRHQVYFTYNLAGAANRIYLALGSSSSYSFLFVNHTVTLNTWFHLAISRDSSNNIRWFINGTQVGTTQVDSKTFFPTARLTQRLGNISYESGDLFGYIDEFRISNTARYTANFTAPTAPFVNDSNTLLLIHGNGTNASTVFLDDNGVRSPKGISANGNAQISTAQSKFGGSSALFDGTGDFLTVATNDFDLSKYKGPNGQYTVEAFVRIGNLANTSVLQGTLLAPTMLGNMTPGAGYQFWSFGPVSDGRVAFYYYNGSSQGLYTTGVTLTTNVWYHVAFVYNAGVGKIYVDGVERASATLVTDAMYEITTPFTIGSAGNTSFNGYIDEIRVSKTARYTTGFTPTTTPFVDDNDTVLLLQCDGTNALTTFIDNNSGSYTFTTIAQRPKSITARGNAQVSTAQSKFGGASAIFDGTGDYLFVDSTQDLNHGTDNFTIEFQVRFSSTNQAILIDYRSANLQGPNPTIYWTGSTIRFYQSGVDRITSGSLSLNTWYHVALSRSGTSTRMFINGTQAGSTYTDSTNYVIGGRMTIGADSFSAGTSSLNGYMDEIRVSNTARYTANFTAPTVAFTNDANTLLLIHCNGTNASTTFSDDNA